MTQESNDTSIKQIFQGLAGEGVQVLQGVVLTPPPELKIQIVNDSKLTITKNNTTVPWQLTDYITTVTIMGKGEDRWNTEYEQGGSGEAAFERHRHKIKGTKKIRINNALIAGDKVHVLAYNHGKQYYVLDRVEGIVLDQRAEE